MPRLLISGASGLVGSKLIDHFQRKSFTVSRLVRGSSLMTAVDSTTDVSWDIPNNRIDAEKCENHDVVIHLAGATISRRWTTRHRKEILDSRVLSTRLLCQTLKQLKQKPGLLVSASAIGFYGNHPSEITCDESSPLGNGFLPDVCAAWERETEVLTGSSIRVVRLRFGIILSPHGGALGKMLPIFKLGLGGSLGHGRQMMSWVALSEIPTIIEHLIAKTDISGPVNAVASNPVSNVEFTNILGRALHRPVILPAPSFAIKFAFGEMGEKLLLEGVRVQPKRLLESGYAFRYPDLESALTMELAGPNV